jgi:hypothetical protein
MHTNEILELPLNHRFLWENIEHGQTVIHWLARICGLKKTPNDDLERVTVLQVIESLREKASILLDPDPRNSHDRASATLTSRAFFKGLEVLGVKVEDLNLPEILLETLPEKPGKIEAILEQFTRTIPLHK